MAGMVPEANEIRDLSSVQSAFSVTPPAFERKTLSVPLQSPEIR